MVASSERNTIFSCRVSAFCVQTAAQLLGDLPMKLFGPNHLMNGSCDVSLGLGCCGNSSDAGVGIGGSLSICCRPSVRTCVRDKSRKACSEVVPLSPKSGWWLLEKQKGNGREGHRHLNPVSNVLLKNTKAVGEERGREKIQTTVIEQQ